MGTNRSQSFQGVMHFTREALAIFISIISFVISTVNVYVTNLKSPDLSVIVAPYIRHIVDDQSLNEAFFYSGDHRKPGRKARIIGCLRAGRYIFTLTLHIKNFIEPIDNKSARQIGHLENGFRARATNFGDAHAGSFGEHHRK